MEVVISCLLQVMLQVLLRNRSSRRKMLRHQILWMNWLFLKATLMMLVSWLLPHLHLFIELSLPLLLTCDIPLQEMLWTWLRFMLELDIKERILFTGWWSFWSTGLYENSIAEYHRHRSEVALGLSCLHNTQLKLLVRPSHSSHRLLPGRLLKVFGTPSLLSAMIFEVPAHFISHKISVILYSYFKWSSLKSHNSLFLVSTAANGKAWTVAIWISQNKSQIMDSATFSMLRTSPSFPLTKQVRCSVLSYHVFLTSTWDHWFCLNLCPGARFGLSLTLNIEQYEYMRGPQSDAGIKVRFIWSICRMWFKPVWHKSHCISSCRCSCMQRRSYHKSVTLDLLFHPASTLLWPSDLMRCDMQDFYRSVPCRNYIIIFFLYQVPY